MTHGLLKYLLLEDAHVAAHATLHISQRFYRSYLLGYQCTVSYMSNNDVNVSIGDLSLGYMLAGMGYD